MVPERSSRSWCRRRRVCSTACAFTASLAAFVVSLALLVGLRVLGVGGCPGLHVGGVWPVKGGMSEGSWTAVHWLGMRNLGLLLDLAVPWMHRVAWSAPPSSAAAGGGGGGAAAHPRLAFTFDDALGANATAFTMLLDFLEAEQVPATFFVIADENTLGSDHPRVLRDAWGRGHELGNHGLENARMSGMSREEFSAAVDRWESDVAGAVRQPWPRPSASKWFRPPQGMMSTAMDAELAERGYRVVLGDLYSDDWAGADEQFHAGVIKAAAQDGSIVILHVMDEARTLRTLEIMRDVVPALRGRGFRFVGLSELFQAAASDAAAPVCAECPLCVYLLAASLVGLLGVAAVAASRICWRMSKCPMHAFARLVLGVVRPYRRLRLESFGDLEPGTQLSPPCSGASETAAGAAADRGRTDAVSEK